MGQIIFNIYLIDFILETKFKATKTKVERLQRHKILYILEYLIFYGAMTLFFCLNTISYFFYLFYSLNII